MLFLAHSASLVMAVFKPDETYQREDLHVLVVLVHLSRRRHGRQLSPLAVPRRPYIGSFSGQSVRSTRSDSAWTMTTTSTV